MNQYTEHLLDRHAALLAGGRHAEARRLAGTASDPAAASLLEMATRVHALLRPVGPNPWFREALGARLELAAIRRHPRRPATVRLVSQLLDGTSRRLVARRRSGAPRRRLTIDSSATMSYIARRVRSARDADRHRAALRGAHGLAVAALSILAVIWLHRTA